MLYFSVNSVPSVAGAFPGLCLFWGNSTMSRYFVFAALGLAAASSPSLLAETRDEPRRPHIVFVTGDCEYRSEISMPMIAKILESKHGMKCSVCYATEEKTGERKPKHLGNIQGLEALKTADLAVFFLRFRQLPESQLQAILDYVNSGRPVVGLRTSTHAFRYPSGSFAKWNDGFGQEVFGQRWITHHGHDSSTKVYVAVKDHPITRGIAPEFHCRSWLYQVMPLQGDCQPLLIGAAVKGDKPVKEIFGTPNPVAWTKTRNGARVFFTTLGHPMDFENESARRLLVNGIYWALSKDIPPEGTNVEIEGRYIAPPTTRAVPDPTLRRNPARYAQADEGSSLAR
jgi:type 1 glutamine amidotransferase